MFAIRRKSDGKFLTKSYWPDKKWSDDPNKARMFTRRCDAKQSRGWLGGTIVGYDGARRPVFNTLYLYGEQKKSFVPYTDENRPVEIVELAVTVKNRVKELQASVCKTALSESANTIKDVMKTLQDLGVL